jgi:DNA-binding XRE family transcriptional regulator
MPSTRRSKSIIAKQKVTIAKRFQTLRRTGGVTQGQLAGVLGLSRQAVNEIENRRVTPHYSTLGKFHDLKAKHERARALSRVLAAEIPPRRRDITKNDNRPTSSQNADPQPDCGLKWV